MQKQQLSHPLTHDNQNLYEGRAENSRDIASLRNTKLGRRAFLKKTGAATVTTAVALHGFRAQVQAQQTGNNVTMLEFRETVFRGNIGAAIQVTPALGNPPSATELATYLASHPYLALGPAVDMTSLLQVGEKTISQDYLGPNEPALVPGYPVTKWELSPPTSFQISSIAIINGFIGFEVSNAKWRVTVEIAYQGSKIGPQQHAQTPADPNFPWP